MNNPTVRHCNFLMPVLGITLIFLLIFSSRAISYKGTSEINDVNQKVPELKKGMYVIIGAFQIMENAVKYAKVVKVKGKTPVVGLNRKSNLFLVYAYTTQDDLAFVREKRSELRATKEFFDAWILYVDLDLADLEKMNIPVEEVAMEQPKEPEPLFIPPPPTSQNTDQELFDYRFNVISATTLKEVTGYVTLIDAARSKAMKSVSTNQTHQLAAPNSQTKEIIALSDIFGYAKSQIQFKIDDPTASADNSLITKSGGVTTVKFELFRNKVGDILTMYNVYFYSNAAIMKPESKFELNSLLGMLKENEKLEIKIHGHTNGNASGKIISLKDGDSNYFEISADNSEKMGSAGALSKARAEVIKRWLVDQGIDEKRMELKGWGGKKMIYGKTDQMAGKNVRVEIELLKG